LSENPKKTSHADSSNIKIKVVVAVVCVVLVVVGFYFLNFNFFILKNENWQNIFQNFSRNTGDWGVFGDYTLAGYLTLLLPYLYFIG